MTHQATTSPTCIAKNTYSSESAAAATHQHKQAITFILNDESAASFALNHHYDTDNCKSKQKTEPASPSAAATLITAPLADKDHVYRSPETSRLRQMATRVPINEASTNQLQSAQIEDTLDASSCSDSEDDEFGSEQALPSCCRTTQIELKEYKKRITALMALVSKQTNEIHSLRSIIHSHNEVAGKKEMESIGASPCHCLHARKRNKQF